jgi:hypothetical protein
MKIAVNTNIKNNKLFSLCHLKKKLSMLNLTFGAVSAGAASVYGSGSTKMMRLLAAPAPQH